MKTYCLLFLVSLFFSCATQRSSIGKPSHTTQPEQTDSAEEGNADIQVGKEVSAEYYRGKVVLSSEGCSLKIIPSGEQNNCYYPVNLEEKFHVDGAMIAFHKYPSRAPLPPGCESCQAIIVENVVRQRK